MPTLTAEPAPADEACHTSLVVVDDVAPTPSPAPEDEARSGLDRPVTTAWLLRFAAPTIGSMLVINVLGMVEGLFAARFISPEALAVVNLVWPFMGFVMAVAFMLSIGGVALVVKQVGEGKIREARQNFTMLGIITLATSVLISAVGLMFPDALLTILGVDAYLHDLSLEYLVPLLFVLPVAMCGFFVQQYFVAEGRPKVGFVATVAAGGVNLLLNTVLIVHLGWGLRGAALATGIGFSVPALVGAVFFARNRRGTLYLTRPRWDLRAFGVASLNGTSEMVSMLASAVNIVVMNNLLMRMVGFEAVAASGVMWVAQAMLMSTFLGFATGVAPIISYNYGARDRERLNRVFSRSLLVVAVASAAAIVIGWFAAHPLTYIYVSPDSPIYDISIRSTHIMLLGFVFMGFNAFAAILFASLNNGVISGVLSFFRTFVFVLAMLLLLPVWFDLDGVWMALPVAEALAFVMTVWLVIRYRKHYGYA